LYIEFVVSGDVVLRNPTTGWVCARAACGQEAAAPTTSFMKSRRFMSRPRCSRRIVSTHTSALEGVKRSAGYVRFGS
jgi:hypothetical protein